jgi:hypothetical protein
MWREIPVTVARLDPESAGWLRALADTGPPRDAALARLYELLVHIARGEAARQDAFRLYRAEATDATSSPADPQFLATGR